QDVVAEQLEGQRSLSTERLRERGKRFVAMAAARAREHRQRFLVPTSGERVELTGQFGDRLIPGDFLEGPGAAGTGALQRMRNPIGVKRNLNRRLPARTQSALADGMARLSFQLL